MAKLDNSLGFCCCGAFGFEVKCGMFGATYFCCKFCAEFGALGSPRARKSVTFCIFLSPWDPKGTQASKRHKKRDILKCSLEAFFALVRHFLECYLQCIFQVLILMLFGPIWRQMGSKRDVLEGHFDAIWEAGPTCGN